MAVPTHIAFGDRAARGARAIGESPKRLDAAKRQPEGTGGRVSAFRMTMDGQDIVLVH